MLRPSVQTHNTDPASESRQNRPNSAMRAAMRRARTFRDWLLLWSIPAFASPIGPDRIANRSLPCSRLRSPDPPAHADRNVAGAAYRREYSSLYSVAPYTPADEWLPDPDRKRPGSSPHLPQPRILSVAGVS